MRTVVREPQLAEQLVEVPTNPGYALAVVAVQTLGWRTAAALIEQFGDTPAGGGSRGGTPPGQGGMEILARDDVDAASIMQLVFHQSKSYVFFAAIQFPRQSAGNCSCATEGRFHSAALEQGRRRRCVRQLPTVLTVQSSCVHRQGRRHPCSQRRKLNDNFEAKGVLFRRILRHFSDSLERG